MDPGPCQRDGENDLADNEKKPIKSDFSRGMDIGCGFIVAVVVGIALAPVLLPFLLAFLGSLLK